MPAPETIIFAAQTAITRGIVDVPLFDPPYVVSDDNVWKFSPSSRNPHFNDGCNVDLGPGTAGNQVSQISYKRDSILTPFTNTTVIGGNKATGFAARSAAVHFGSQARHYTTYNSINKNTAGYSSILLPAGISNLTAPLNDENFWVPSFGPYYINPPTVYPTPNVLNLNAVGLFWNADALTGLYPSLWVGFATYDNVAGSGFTQNLLLAPYVAGGLAKLFNPYYLVGGAPPFSPIGSTFSYLGFQATSLNRFAMACTGHMAGNPRTNWLMETTTVNVNGTQLHMVPVSLLNSAMQPAKGTSLVFDDANITAIVNSGNYDLQGTDYGFLISWPSSAYSIVGGQASQSILLNGTYNSGDVLTPASFDAPFYSVIRWNPNTVKSKAAVAHTGIPDVKIDPNGIAYFRERTYDGTYVANSAGFNIVIPGVAIPEVNALISFPSFCPCSPVAVPVGGA